jgi:cytochrome b6-f complex iron-sulfur subunit
MTEQEKQDQTTEEPAAEAGAAVEATEAAAPEKKPRKEQAAAPAGPSTAVLAPRNVPGTPMVSRRTVLRVSFWSSLGAIVAGIAACGLDIVYPRGVTGFGGTVSAGEVSQYPAGSKTQVPEGRFWIVNLTAEQGGPGLLALWWKCPHLGCTVPWRPEFVWPDPVTGAPKKGWFRCPCHGSTYTDAGVRVFGPAPRSMDTMAMVIANGRISVNTGAVTPGGPDNPDRAVRP